MDVKKSTIKEEGSCNFCNRGKISNSGSSLTYPYEDVVAISGSKMTIVICEKCLNEIKKINF